MFVKENRSFWEAAIVESARRRSFIRFHQKAMRKTHVTILEVALFPETVF